MIQITEEQLRELLLLAAKKGVSLTYKDSVGETIDYWVDLKIRSLQSQQLPGDMEDRIEDTTKFPGDPNQSSGGIHPFA